MQHAPLKVLVVGATGGSGLAAVKALLAAGHEVTAFSRHADRMSGLAARLNVINGDATDPAQVERAVQGQDAVIVTLGITGSALRVRLLGSTNTPLDVRSRGTRSVIAAMHKHGVRKLVVQSSFGVGESRDKLPLIYKLMFSLLLKPQIADTEQQERDVRASGLAWVLAQPVNLTDDSQDTELFASPSGEVRKMKISRTRVGHFLAEALRNSAYVGKSVALSAV
jgi:nucleoside-diphosphate-sugar epimerase